MCLVRRHGGLPGKTWEREGGKATRRDKTRERILERFTGEFKELIKALLEKLMLEDHPPILFTPR